MIFSNATKDLMMTTLSGFNASSYGTIGSATGIKYSLFSGTPLTDIELQDFYVANVTNVSGVLYIAGVEAKIVSLGKTLLGTASIKPVSIVPTSRSRRVFELNDKALVPTASGDAEFGILSITEDNNLVSALFLFTVGQTDEDVIIRDPLIAGQTVYLNDLAVDLNLGVMR